MNSAVPVLDASEIVWTARSRGAEVGFTLRLRHGALERGSMLAVCGPSGCGKSTLLGLLALALAPRAIGTFRLAGHDAAALWRDGRTDRLTELRSRLIGFVPQVGGLLSFLSIGENIRLQQQIIGHADPRRIEALTERLGIASLLRRRPAEISVGQRQRAVVARALAHEPLLLLADEPTASLHPAQADDVLSLLAEAARDGTAVVVATHDAQRARTQGFGIVQCEIDPLCAATDVRFDQNQG